MQVTREGAERLIRHLDVLPTGELAVMSSSWLRHAVAFKYRNLWIIEAQANSTLSYFVVHKRRNAIKLMRSIVHD